MRTGKPGFLFRFTVLFACSLTGAMLGYGVKLWLFKPFTPNARIDGLGILLISLTMQLPIILGGSIGILIGFFAAVFWPEKEPASFSGPNLKHTSSRKETAGQEAPQVRRTTSPYAPAGMETYKTKLMKAYLENKKLR